MSETKQYTIATSYKFVRIDDLGAMKARLKGLCDRNSIKGTILVASEGINFTIAGKEKDLNEALKEINEVDQFKDLQYNNLTTASFIPFKKMKIRLKKEIVALKDGKLDMKETSAGYYLESDEWDKLIARDDVIVIDTRNSYEYAFGTFKNAINPDTQAFSELPEWFAKNVDMTNKNQEIAMFCTGGIRCEKSTAYVKSLGFNKVYHLKGGVLKYFEETKGKQNRWDGTLFIFDDRIALDKDLNSINQSSRL